MGEINLLQKLEDWVKAELVKIHSLLGEKLELDDWNYFQGRWHALQMIHAQIISKRLDLKFEALEKW